MTYRGIRNARYRVGRVVMALGGACHELGENNPGGYEWILAYRAVDEALAAACDLYMTLNFAIYSMEEDAPCSR